MQKGSFAQKMGLTFGMIAMLCACYLPEKSIPEKGIPEKNIDDQPVLEKQETSSPKENIQEKNIIDENVMGESLPDEDSSSLRDVRSDLSAEPLIESDHSHSDQTNRDPAQNIAIPNVQSQETAEEPSGDSSATVKKGDPKNKSNLTLISEHSVSNSVPEEPPSPQGQPVPSVPSTPESVSPSGPAEPVAEVATPSESSVSDPIAAPEPEPVPEAASLTIQAQSENTPEEVVQDINAQLNTSENEALTDADLLVLSEEGILETGDLETLSLFLKGEE